MMQTYQPQRNFEENLQRPAKAQLATWHNIASSRRERGLLISAPGFSLNFEDLKQAITGSHHLIPPACPGRIRCRWLTLLKEGSIDDLSLLFT